MKVWVLYRGGMIFFIILGGSFRARVESERERSETPPPISLIIHPLRIALTSTADPQAHRYTHRRWKLVLYHVVETGFRLLVNGGFFLPSLSLSRSDRLRLHWMNGEWVSIEYSMVSKERELFFTRWLGIRKVKLLLSTKGKKKKIWPTLV